MGVEVSEDGGAVWPESTVGVEMSEGSQLGEAI